MSKMDFLDNLRLARNLIVHGRVTADSRHLDPAAFKDALARAAIWLTPSAVGGFDAGDFKELGAAKQGALASAVQEFQRLATQVRPDAPATRQHIVEATAVLEKILTILANYLPSHEEASRIQATLASLDFPEWVLNWDFEVGSDPDGVPAVWVTLYADENSIPPDQFGKRALEMIPKLRSALTAAGLRRWPYIRMRTALEHRTGAGVG